MEDFISSAFKISIQPKQNFHYRYLSELKETHGVITGRPHPGVPNLQPQKQNRSQKSVPVDIWPTVTLQLPSEANFDENGNKREFYVLCSLHSCNGSEAFSLSPFLLMAKGTTEANHNFIFCKMNENEDPLQRIWELRDYVIVRIETGNKKNSKVFSNYKQSFEKKRSHYNSLKLPMEIDELLGTLDIDKVESLKRSGTLNVCLGFTVFEKIIATNSYRLYKNTTYSDNIYHGDDLCISKLCNLKGSVTGGLDVTFLMNGNSGHKYNVHMTLYDKTSSQLIWKEVQQIQEKNIHKNCAYSFILPKGPVIEDVDEFKVALEVVVDNSTYKSQPIPFCYVNNKNEDIPPRKRARKEETTDEEVNFTPEEIAEVLLQVLDKHNSEQEMPTNISAQNATVVGTNVLPSVNIELPICENFNENNSQVIWEYSIPLESLQDNNISSSMPIHLNSQYNNPSATSTAGVQQDWETSSTEDLIQLISTLPQPTIPIENPISSKEDNDNSYISRDRIILISTDLTNPDDNIPKNVPQKMTELKKHCASNISSHNGKIMKRASYVIQQIDKYSGNTIFHEAIMDDTTLLTLYRQMKINSKKDQVLKARNKFRQNLLHYACWMNRAKAIKPLVFMGCGLHEQDLNGCTPLHIAIKFDHKECISKFQLVLETPNEYPKNIQNMLVEMFQVHDDLGRTVLHAAVVAELRDLFESMLKFCKLHKVEAWNYGLLSNGDTVVHLIAKNSVVILAPLVREYIPGYLNLENYAGETVQDIPDLTMEVRQALLIPDVFKEALNEVDELDEYLSDEDEFD
ncbi:uncharacterized protein LOC142238050 [Haematobia irritans]|uniref:uncharacterized protein LOC142238050 n=1 Tax=Haematobia irritans TaxID=7368 RepID=UPI003F4FEA63